jgi:hypothetical protein
MTLALSFFFPCLLTVIVWAIVHSFRAAWPALVTLLRELDR